MSAQQPQSTPPPLFLEAALQDGPVQATDLPWPAPCGAEAVFLGRTRIQAHPQLGALIRLEYEVYPEMAEKVLRQMAQDAAQRFGCLAVRIVHARGAVELGQASVVIQVATPHRGEAFTACRYLIDRLKHELPIWKHEIWERGRTFVEGCCAHDESAAPAAADEHQHHEHHQHHDHGQGGATSASGGPAKKGTQP